MKNIKILSFILIMLIVIGSYPRTGMAEVKTKSDNRSMAVSNGKAETGKTVLTYSNGKTETYSYTKYAPYLDKETGLEEGYLDIKGVITDNSIFGIWGIKKTVVTSRGNYTTEKVNGTTRTDYGGGYDITEKINSIESKVKQSYASTYTKDKDGKVMFECITLFGTEDESLLITSTNFAGGKVIKIKKIITSNNLYGGSTVTINLSGKNSATFTETVERISKSETKVTKVIKGTIKYTGNYIIYENIPLQIK